MCIIIAKPRGMALPKESILENCFDANSSGAGYSFWRSGDSMATVKKGFFTLEAMTASMKKHGIGKNTTAILHFRLATHGAVDGGNCHPFPISHDMDKMRELDCKVSHAVAHNGIFAGLDHKTYSDTILWIASHLADSAIIDGLKRPAIQHLICDALGSSKLAICSPLVGATLLFGKWFHDKDSGCYYSNEGYKRTSYTSYESGGWRSGYGWEGGASDWCARDWKVTSTAPTKLPITKWDGCEICGSQVEVRVVEDMDVCKVCAGHFV